MKHVDRHDKTHPQCDHFRQRTNKKINHGLVENSNMETESIVDRLSRMSGTWPAPDKQFFQIFRYCNSKIAQWSEKSGKNASCNNKKILTFIYCEILVDLQIRGGAQLLIIRILCNRICRQGRIGWCNSSFEKIRQCHLLTLAMPFLLKFLF
jgi:hypothetical protein